MELIDRVKKDIDERLEELRPQIEEIPQLEKALAALDATGKPGAAAPAAERRGRGRPRGQGSRAPRRRGPRRRARRGHRREELLQLVRGNPEVTIAEAARQMGVSSPQVSTLVRRLREEGVLERADGRFVVVEPTTFSDGEDASAGDRAGDGDEAADAPEAASDEAGRPQAT